MINTSRILSQAVKSFDKDNVLVCRIVKEDNFLKFVILGTALELDHLESAKPMNREKLYDLIKREYSLMLSRYRRRHNPDSPSDMSERQP